ncbi:unnamed protein product [Rotaria magnacalcarata]|uniref:Uncharacterized protein n=1 Tax=Rotaria magnacalcarata TaxID=392030 RepID=A0A819KH68_9BILA|nr:unnamed protein product [Rotaria magnacalcarata]CAF2170698.1 unnamed protein product [Rotaria magnacalcarata]CAF3947375.1 unnamed protein product [Rotaria magnacalcarata]CAF5037007.1 unnamed protein product [Rotaria magnacalcarata]
MSLLFSLCLLSIPIGIFANNTYNVTLSPFYLRARIHDSRTADIQFEIEQNNTQRECRTYEFTIRHNDKNSYSMPQQNLTFWRNSLELTQLTVGKYNICAIICSEYLKTNDSYDKILKKRASLEPIAACVTIRVYRSHFLILTLYILVFIILVFLQITFTLRKRKFHAQIQHSLAEFKHMLHKWNAAQEHMTSTVRRHSSSTLHDLFTQSASSIEHSIASLLHLTAEEHQLPHFTVVPFENSNDFQEQPKTFEIE